MRTHLLLAVSVVAWSSSASADSPGSGRRVSMLAPRTAARGDVPQGRPISLTSSDLEGDGVPDLIVGFDEGGVGSIVVYRGNRDSVWPNGPGARERSDHSPFLEPEPRLRLAERPDWLAAGDFDNDGHVDVVVAETGDRSIALLRGAGDGGFTEVRRQALPGTVTSLAAGEIDRADGLADLAVAVVAADGSRLLVFEHPDGALAGPPETHALPRAAGQIVLADLDGDFDRDAVVAAGTDLVVVHGRDRKLTWPEPVRASVAPAAVERFALGSEPRRFAVERVIDPSHNGIAWLDDEGRGHIARRAGAEGASSAGPPADFVLAAGLSGNAVRDVVSLERERRRLSVRRPDGVEERIELAGNPIAALAMRLNADAVDDLVILQEPPAAPVVAVLSAPAAVFVVTSTSAHGPGSLDQAILDANASPGIDAITFAIPGAPPFVIVVPTNVLPWVDDTVTIDGTTQPGYAGTPVVILEVNHYPEFWGLRVNSSNSSIRGLAFQRFSDAQVILFGSNNSVQGCWLGSDGSLLNDWSGVGVTATGVGFHEIGGIEPNVIAGNAAGVESQEELRTRLAVPALPIPSQGTVTSTMQPGAPQYVNRPIDDVSVNVKITHATIGQLTVTLIHPDGTRVVLVRNRGGSSSGLNGWFDDESTLSIADDTPPLIGSWRPEEPLSVLNGKTISGVWSLEVTDDADPTGGTLDRWELFLRFRPRGNRIVGNRIGTNREGTAQLQRNATGIFLSGNEDLVKDNIVSGTRVYGSSGHALIIDAGFRARIQSNRFGTNADGTVCIGNDGGIVDGSSGTVYDHGTDLLFGGTAAGAGNVVSCGLLPFDLTDSTGYLIQGNRFGTDATGAFALGGRGLVVRGDTDVLIGGASAAARNVISGVGEGVLVSPTTAPTRAPTIVGNFLGTSADGLDPIPNGSNGIALREAAARVMIDSNRIAHNAGAGVSVEAGARHTILRNEISSNAGLGIEIHGAPGPDANDPLDADAGPNGTQNYPVLTGAAPFSGGTLVQGSLHSVPGGEFRIDFYASPTSDPSGFGEGAAWRGSTQVSTDGNGNAAFSFVAIGTAAKWTATATASDGSTSEFSAAVSGGVPTPAPAEASADGGMRASRAGGDVAVTYEPACDAIDHAVVWGTSPIAGALAWSGAACGFGTTGLLQVPLPDPSAGALVYFVVVGRAATVEGSYGQDSSHVERPEATGLVTCDLPRSLAPTCP